MLITNEATCMSCGRPTRRPTGERDGCKCHKQDPVQNAAQDAQDVLDMTPPEIDLPQGEPVFVRQSIANAEGMSEEDRQDIEDMTPPILNWASSAPIAPTTNQHQQQQATPPIDPDQQDVADMTPPGLDWLK